MKRVAVTGASGHLGANLVRELLRRGYEVVALVRQTSLALEGLDVEIAHGDLSDQQSLARAFKDVEQVYHLAAYISLQSGDKEKLQLVNVAGTRNVIDACQSEGVATLIYFSTIHALDQRPLDQAVTEENPLIGNRQSRGGDYEHSKVQADRLVREHNKPSLSTRIIYPTAVLGPHDFNLSLFGQVILKMATGRLPALVAGGYDWVDARDVVWGAVEAAEKGVDGDRYILSGHYLNISEIASVITDLTGATAPRFTSPAWLARLSAPLLGAWARLQGETPIYTRDSLAALSANKLMSHARAANRLGYQPRSFGESMRDTLLFYSEQNLLKEIPGGD